MKKVICLLVCFVMTVSTVPIMAEDFSNEEQFEFSIYDAFTIQDADDAMLMEVSEDVKEQLEERLLAAWENMDTEVQLYPDIKIHRDDIATIYSAIFFENPKYYYVVKNFSGTVNSAGYMGTLTKLAYTTDDMDEIKAEWEQLDKATEEILLYISPDMTDFEKIVAVHDYMVLNYVYDVTDMDQSMRIMLDRVGVCAAYSEAFQHMMNVLGIKSTVVRSNDMGHIWNLVMLDGKWYHIDVTWDDPAPDQAAMVSHKHLLLSTAAITSVGHCNFDMWDYSADSTLYDNASWHYTDCAITTINGVMYSVEGNDIVDENGNVIYEELDDGDGYWNISQKTGIENQILSGLCEINGVMYFNTDTGIYSYVPETEKVECILSEYGICGIYADENVLRYNNYDSSTGGFIDGGEIRMSDIKLGEPYYEDGKAVVRLYNDTDVPLWIISKGDGYMVEKVDSKSIGTAQFENGSEQTIYIWKNSLEPVFETFTISE